MSSLLALMLCHTAGAQLLKPIPRQYSLDSFMPPVKDQHDRNSCAAFATLCALECEINLKSGLQVDLSEQYLHTLAADSFSGLSNYFYCYFALKSNGVLLERDWPYQFSFFGPGLPCEGLGYHSSSVPSFCFRHAPPPTFIKDRKIQLKFKMKEVTSTRNTCKVISMNHPVIMWIPMEFQDNSDKTGILSVDTNKFQMLEGIDGHFVVAYGYDLDKNVFYIQNSYGNSWGNQGRGTMPFRYFRKLKNTYSGFFNLDSIWGFPQTLPTQQNDSVWLYNADTKAFFQDDSSMQIQIRGYQSPAVLNAFSVTSEVVVRNKSDKKGDFQLLRLNRADSIRLKTKSIHAIRHSISSPMEIVKETFSTIEPFTLKIPKHLACSSTLTAALQDPSQEVRIRTRINWHTDTYGLSCYQEYLTPIQGGFQASE